MMPRETRGLGHEVGDLATGDSAPPGVVASRRCGARRQPSWMRSSARVPDCTVARSSGRSGPSIEGRGDLAEVGARDDVLHRRQPAKLERGGTAAIECRRAAHHERAKRRLLARRAADALSKFGLGVRGHRATVEYRDVGLARAVATISFPALLDHRADRLAVVLVRATPEGAQVHLHASTVPPAAWRRTLAMGPA